jgi:hypothetical protein
MLTIPRNAQKMRAVQISHDRMKLRSLARELAHECKIARNSDPTPKTTQRIDPVRKVLEDGGVMFRAKGDPPRENGFSQWSISG